MLLSGFMLFFRSDRGHAPVGRRLSIDVLARSVRRAAIMAGLAVHLCGCSSAPEQVEPWRVKVSTGWLLGGVEGDVVAFRGIPYAEPPTGERRWRPPGPPKAWTEDRDARSYGPPCVQPRKGEMIGSEDCLTLNVWTPATRPSDGPLPVMFYIHGGANFAGEGARYDGAILARDAVVVTINYRLGVLGFLAHEAFASESPHKSAGNYAILDQIQALRWVQRNVSSFGGDPGKVMVFGTSAGAVNSCALLVSPLARELFHSMILESGPCLSVPKSNARRIAERTAVYLGCAEAEDPASCLRSVPPEKLVRVPGAGETPFPPECYEPPPGFKIMVACRFEPAVDGWVVPDRIQTMLERGDYAPIPIAIGTTLDEYELPTVHPPMVKTTAEYEVLLDMMFGSQSDAVKEVYPAQTFESPHDALIEVWTDWLMTCPARRSLRAIRDSGTQPVYQFVWAHVFDHEALRPYGAAHGFNVPFVFHDKNIFRNLMVSSEFAFSATEIRLSDATAGYWKRMARNGNPNEEGAALWPEFGENEEYIVLDWPPSNKKGYRGARCDALDKVDAVLGIGPL